MTTHDCRISPRFFRYSASFQFIPRKRVVFYFTRLSFDFIGISALTFDSFCFSFLSGTRFALTHCTNRATAGRKNFLRLMRKRMKNKLVHKLIQYLEQWISSRSARQFQSEPKTFETKKADKLSSVKAHLPKVLLFLKKRFR